MRNTEDQRGAWGAYVKTARSALGLSQSELARQLGVDRVTVYRWEARAQRPESVDTVVAVVEILRLDEEEAMAAAGFKPGAQAPAAPRQDLDEELQLIMLAPVDEATKELMIKRLLDRRDREKRARIDDLQFMIDQAKKRAG